MNDIEILNEIEPLFNTCMSNDNDIPKVKSLNDNLYTDLGFNSLSLSETLMMIEHKYKIQIDYNDLSGIETMQDLINIIKKYINNGK